MVGEVSDAVCGKPIAPGMCEYTCTKPVGHEGDCNWTVGEQFVREHLPGEVSEVSSPVDMSGLQRAVGDACALIDKLRAQRDVLRSAAVYAKELLEMSLAHVSHGGPTRKDAEIVLEALREAVRLADAEQA